jgi:AcrR family transcriptional regulator
MPENDPPPWTTNRVGPRLAPEDRRRHLLDVARSIVESDGAAALTMEAVANRAGVSRALLYTYFDNRSGLLRALWDEVATLWDVEPMPPVEQLIADSTPRRVFEERLVANTKWYFDQIEQGGLLFYRLMSEPQLEASVEAMRKRVHSDNVAWWARLLETMGIDAERALVFSSLFNGTSETMWELIARGLADRAVIEEVFFMSSRLTLDRLLEQAAAESGA